MINTDTCFGADEANAAGVHATQLTAVEGRFRRLRCGRTVAFTGANASSGIDLIGANNYVQLPIAGANWAILPHAAGNERGVVAVAHVQTVAADGDGALLHAYSVELTVPKLRISGAQPGFAGVNEAAAVHVDTGGIGHDKVGPLAGHFDATLQLRWRAAIYLIDDYRGFTTN